MRTINGLYRHMRSLYGASNSLRMRHGAGERLAYLGLAHADLCRVLRKEQGEYVPVALAQYTAWLLCLAEGLFAERGGRIMAEAMAYKYPSAHCGYCHKNPCECSQLVRSTHKLNGDKDETQARWTLRKWQDHLSSVYGPNNVCRGVHHAMMRLSEEFGEIGALIVGLDHAQSQTTVLEQECAGELADILAWVLAVAHQTGHCLESAVVALYKDGCPQCKHDRCACAAILGGGCTMRRAQELMRKSTMGRTLGAHPD